MKATFQIAVDLRVLVCVIPESNVALEIIEGTDWEGNGANLKTKMLTLSKSEARAIASAMMACAAEL